MKEIIAASATALAKAIREKRVSSEEVINAYLKRIRAVNPKLNAVVQELGDAACEQARAADRALARGNLLGPFHGVPMTIKDTLDTAGVITTGGTQGRARFVPKEDAFAVARMRSAGAILLGKTNVPELALAPETDNLVYGRTNNPYDLSRSPAGSSGGEASIIAAGGSPIGLGSDCGGSIRSPAHFCGIAGMKPTTGRVSRTGHFPPVAGLMNRLWQIGPLARFVEDLILALRVIMGPDGRDPVSVPMPLGDPGAVVLKNLRVAFYTDNGILPPTPETTEVVKKTVKVLSDLVMSVDENCPKEIERTYDIWWGLASADRGAGVKAILKQAGTTELHLYMKRFLDVQLDAKPMVPSDFGSLIAEWDTFCSAMTRFFENYDVIICPVIAFPAQEHGFIMQKDKDLGFSYCFSYNLTGWPAVVVRGGTSPEGLPIGVQVVARPWREEVALVVAQHIETALGGWQPPPL
ncbi:MAG TPA: amidase [Thermodesulfobacteriota bacterium]|nr:amidase [Thermodesulfobacteriota bacterium]